MNKVAHSTPPITGIPQPFQPTDDRAVRTMDNDYFVRQAFAESAEKGMESLFRLYYPALCSHALRFVYTKEIAEDMVGEVFYQLWKSGAYATIQYTYRTYLYAAVRHRAFNYLRDEMTGSRTPESLDTIHDVGVQETPQTLIEYDETFQRLEQIIHTLPPQCQRVFMMSRFENRKNQEIADELGLALKTVEAHMARALSQLRRVFLPLGLLVLDIISQGM